MCLRKGLFPERLQMLERHGEQMRKEMKETETKQMGKQSIVFESKPVILAAASVVGKKEGEGPLGGFFDEVEQDPMFGGKILFCKI